MRIVVQRCLDSSVAVNDEIIGKIKSGMNLLVCIEKTDHEKVIKKAAYKVGNLRIFEDPKTRKMSHNISKAHGKFLVISQFTLSWRGEKGHRPSFDKSMPPEKAEQLFNLFCLELEEYAPVEKGLFAADMKVGLINDGPVTFILDF